MQTMTDEQAKYAYTCIDNQLRHRPDIQPRHRPDIRQAAIAQVLRRFNSYDPTKASWRTFVSTESRWAICEAVKQMRRHPDPLIDAEELEEEITITETPEAYPDMAEAYLGMTDRQRTICDLLAEGWTARDIQSQLAISRTQYEADRTAIRAVLLHSIR